MAARFPHSGGGGRRRTGAPALVCRLAALLLPLVLLLLGAVSAAAKDAAPTVPPTRTDSPRDTLATFQRLREGLEAELRAYEDDKTYEGAARLALYSDHFNALIDLTAVPAAKRRERGITTWVYLLDIFGRVGMPDLETVPDAETYEANGDTSFRIPGTPLRILRIEEGEHRDEFLFSGATVDVAPRFFRSIAHMPLETSLDIESFTAFSPQTTGPLVPSGIYRSMPPWLTEPWFDTPLWKVIAVLGVFAVAAAVLVVLHRLVAIGMPKSRLLAPLGSGLDPVAMLLFGSLVLPFLSRQINVSGRFASFVDGIQVTLVYAAYAWLFWLGLRFLSEVFISSPRIPDESLDANLLRLLSGILGIVGVVIILAFGAQAIGLPILSVLAGLGVGGLAVALALRPTLENLIGGVILYVDKPVRVGDFCSFGTLMGTVERIGVRSIKLRALDRTLISVPNAQFADMQIVNWAHCDEMLINETLSLRYETDPDQLRYVLTRLREMLHAHPRINSDTVRVRLANFGESAQNIDMRVYALTREWNDFFAIREDVLLRIFQIVEEAGTGFAFPSRTVYTRSDEGLDANRKEAAGRTVAQWRRSGRLPFPNLPREVVERIEGSLDYPPHGSPGSRAGGEEEMPVSEPLSAEDMPPAAAEPQTGPAPEPKR
jgi:MscS family membrane protein